MSYLSVYNTFNTFNTDVYIERAVFIIPSKLVMFTLSLQSTIKSYVFVYISQVNAKLFRRYG